jgi:hypothetical protein
MDKRTFFAIVTGAFFLGVSSLAQNVQVEEEIARIEKAPAQERWEMMNRFKERLASMQGPRREAAIEALEARMGGASRQASRPMPAMERLIEQHQATQMWHTESMERMGQRQGVEQFIHDHPAYRPGPVPGHLGGIQPPASPLPNAPAGSAPSAQNRVQAPVAAVPFGHRR